MLYGGQQQNLIDDVLIHIEVLWNPAIRGDINFSMTILISSNLCPSPIPNPQRRFPHHWFLLGDTPS